LHHKVGFLIITGSSLKETFTAQTFFYIISFIKKKFFH